MRNRFTVLLSGLMVFLFIHLNAQEDFNLGKRIVGLHVDTSRSNIATIGFDKSLNTYHWAGLAFYNKTIGSTYLQFNQQFLSTLIRTDRKLITDNQTFDLKIRHRLSSNLSAASNLTSFILSDNKSLGSSISKASSHVLYGGIAYQPLEMFVVEPLIGFRLDNQIDQQDNGISYLLGFASDTVSYHGYVTKLRGSFQYDQIQPRTLETYNASLKIDKTFFEQTHNFLQVNYYRNRRDFYLQADTSIQKLHNVRYNIESRADNAFTLLDSLSYNVSRKMSWTFHGNILTREITRTTRYHNLSEPERSPLNTNIDELKIEGGLRASYIFNDHLRSSLTFMYQERDEKHKLEMISESFSAEVLAQAEERKNNHTRRTVMMGTASWAVSPSDTITLSGSANILRYDTPSLENDDDRDELWYLLNLTTSHQINRHLYLRSAIDLNLSHLVYLFSTRSADNNWNRIIRLSPTIIYSPFSDLRSTNTFEVLANYTVYDFEYLAPQPRSFVFRQFGFLDSTSFNLTNRIGIEWFSYLRLYERGEFNWDSFTERPVNSFEDKTVVANVRYSMTKSLLFSLGFRYFSQLRFDHMKNERRLENFLQSMGPTTSIEVASDRISFVVRGWYENQTQTNQTTRTFTTMVMNLSVHI